MSAEITKKTGESVDLVGGAGGIFEIRKDGVVLWKKERNGEFPKPGVGAELFG